MFLALLYRLRADGVPAGPWEHLSLLRALSQGVAVDVDAFYRVARAILCRTEADFDAFDIAFAETIGQAILDEATRARLETWLRQARERTSDVLVAPPFETDRELWEQFLERLRTQTEAHHGGNHWIGTGGTSPFGHGGRASRGIRVGGTGGNRGAIAVAGDRQWEAYRTDGTLQTRDMRVALKSLRRLVREGKYELDLDETIAQTGKQGGEITLVERRRRDNTVRLVLLLDTGGSMAPHAAQVSALFTAARELRTFRSLDVYGFHNCVYNTIWRVGEEGSRLPVTELLRTLTPKHRVVLVGDASMAPWELFHAVGWGRGGEEMLPGIEWLRRLRRAAPSSVWLNPEPRRWWDHPTVDAIGRVFPMYELTLDGIRDAVSALRKPVAAVRAGA